MHAVRKKYFTRVPVSNMPGYDSFLAHHHLSDPGGVPMYVLAV